MCNPDTIANFCGITGCTTDIASAYLEMAQGNLDLAISLYFDILVIFSDFNTVTVTLLPYRNPEN